MSVTGSPFCEHKKLRTSCALCKQAAMAAPPAGLISSPYTATHEREDKAEKKAARPRADGRVVAHSGAAPREAKPNKPTGPGKPLMPTRRTKQKVTAQDEARAEAWWVDRSRDP